MFLGLIYNLLYSIISFVSLEIEVVNEPAGSGMMWYECDEENKDRPSEWNNK